METIVRQCSILEVEAQAVVNPANSTGSMGGGIAAVLKQAGGTEIEAAVMAEAPIAIGDAVVTTGGTSGFEFIIHAPTMEAPAEPSAPEHVYHATLAALQAADEKAIRTVAMPGLGTGVGEVEYATSADQMICAIRDAALNHVSMVILVDISAKMVDAWNRVLNTGDKLRP